MAKTVQYRNMVLTQGSADAFVQQQEYTGIDPSIGNCWLLRQVELNFPNATALQNVSADFSISWSLTRESVTAISDLSNADCLFAGGIAGALTTSGQITLPRTTVWTPPEGLVVVQPIVFAQLDSDATGLSLSAVMRLYFEQVHLNELQILQMLSQG